MGLKFKSSSTDIDQGAKVVKEKIKELRQNPYVEIGILEQDAGSQKTEHTIGKGSVPTLIQVATWNEFGVGEPGSHPYVPQRSFIRATVNENEQTYFNIIGGLKKKILAGELPVRNALALLGQKIQADIINRINSGIGPANAPSTVAAKGSSKPLIDTGQLKQSIRYNVSKGD